MTVLPIEVCDVNDGCGVNSAAEPGCNDKPSRSNMPVDIPPDGFVANVIPLRSMLPPLTLELRSGGDNDIPANKPISPLPLPVRPNASIGEPAANNRATCADDGGGGGADDGGPPRGAGTAILADGGGKSLAATQGDEDTFARVAKRANRRASIADTATGAAGLLGVG